MRDIAQSSLLEVAAFPTAAPCLELVLEYMNHYDNINKHIRKNNGEVLFSIDRQTVIVAMGIPH